MNPTTAVVNIALPVVVLLVFSSPDRLGAIPALLLAIGIPIVYGVYGIARSQRPDASAILGIVSVLLTGVIGVFELNTRLFAVKEAAIPLAFAVLLLVSNTTRYPISTLLADMVLRREQVHSALDKLRREAEYRTLLVKTGQIWAGIMLLSGVLKFLLATFVVTSPAGTEAFNHNLATYELVQLPTTFTLTGVLILSLIWYIAGAAATLTNMETAEVLRGGHKVDRIARRFAPIAKVFGSTRPE